MSIRQSLKQWDGKSATDLGGMYLQHGEQTSFSRDLIDLIKNGLYSSGATWLLNCHLKQNGKLSKSQIKALLHCLNKLNGWQSKLHMLQALEYIAIESAEKAQVEYFLRSCLADANNFVRAWAYNGFYLLSQQYPEYRDEVSEFFDMGMRDETAAVKARIRNILKQRPN